MTGEDVKPALLMLYSTVNPETAATVGKLNAVLHVFVGAIRTGATGNTTAFIVDSWQATFVLIALATVDPHAAVNLYLAFIVQHPGVFVNNAFAAAKVPYALRDPPGACTAYSAVNPATFATAVIFASEALQVLAIAVIVGAAGNTTAFTVASWHVIFVLIELAAVLPHAAVNLYLAFIVQHPGALVNNVFAAAKVPYALRDPPGACTAYSAVNPGTFVTAVILANGALQVFAGVTKDGAEGNTTKFFVSEQLVPCAV